MALIGIFLVAGFRRFSQNSGGPNKRRISRQPCIRLWESAGPEEPAATPEIGLATLWRKCKRYGID
jgi:hypothetical protein